MVLQCQSCRSADTLPMFSLGSMPPVNSFPTEAEFKTEKSFPLDLHYCRRCHLVQLGQTVDPSELFGHYLHMSSASESNRRHLAGVAKLLDEKTGGLKGRKVLEIGSNDGSLLAEMARLGGDALGVDPAKNLAPVALDKGVRAVTGFFLEDTPETLLRGEGPFDVMVSLNVVAHTPDFISLLKGAKKALAEDGLYLIEAAYAVDTILKGQFDTIYHEHVYCFSLHSLNHALEAVGLKALAAEIIPTQGTSVRVFAAHKESKRPVEPSVSKILQDEVRNGFTDEAAYRAAGEKVVAFKKDFTSRVFELRERYGPLIGLGAPARGVVILNYCGLKTDVISHVIDDTPLKQGRFVGGVHIPVKDWDSLKGLGNKAFVLLSWNYKAEILGKLMRHVSDAPILVPFPEMTLIPNAAHETGVA